MSGYKIEIKFSQWKTETSLELTQTVVKTTQTIARFFLLLHNQISQMDNKIVTIKEIASRLNISPSTVSRALHNHKSIGLRTKATVQQLAKELDYEPNQTAIFFQQRKTFTIGVILPELSEAFFSSAISGIEDLANINNYTVLMGQSHDDADREKKLADTMKNHRVDGLIVSIAKNTASYEHFEALKKYDIPVVFFDRIPNMENIHYVACNMSSGTTMAFNFLRKLGHKTIGMITGQRIYLRVNKEWRVTGMP